MSKPINRVINAMAPTRICDVGGWTDTHFARHGAVFNVAISPRVEVQLSLFEANDPDQRVIISAENYKESYPVNPGHIVYGKHPLIEAAIKVMEWPDDIGLRANIYSPAPPGASMGTSAAVSVALVGALDALTDGRLSSHEVAALAHSLETTELGLECGIQDQFASAYGGINLIEMSEYPTATVRQLAMPKSSLWELEQRLLLIYIGKPHNSSDTHKMVIDRMGANAHCDSNMQHLRELAVEAGHALAKGDLPALGRIFNENTAVQRRMHPNLVCEAFEQIIDIASSFNVLGCKVNGAGGDGGSIAILTRGDTFEKRELEQALRQSSFTSLPVRLSREGLHVWETRTA